ncbi:MAG: hypothetical protein V7605_952 [Acidimicrobiaceae bacterium]|jgi:RNA polymerase sigma-70 factor (ECF subfamily)
MNPDPTDAEVIGASGADPPRFAVIFDRHVASIHRFLQRRTGADGADSLTGECFRIAFERRATYQLDRPDALPWLYGIANNVARQDQRGERRRWTAQRRMEAGVAGNEGLVAPDPAHDGLLDRLDAEAVWPAVQAALGAMRPEERDTILLVAWEDLTYREVAIALGVPVGTVRSRLHRARHHLREHLEPVGQQEGDTHTTRNGRLRP